MRWFRYSEFDGETGRDVIISEKEIIETYYAYWVDQMVRVSKEDMINHQNCIEDFCVIHWAVEVNAGSCMDVTPKDIV